VFRYNTITDAYVQALFQFDLFCCEERSNIRQMLRRDPDGACVRQFQLDGAFAVRAQLERAARHRINCVHVRDHGLLQLSSSPETREANPAFLNCDSMICAAGALTDAPRAQHTLKQQSATALRAAD